MTSCCCSAGGSSAPTGSRPARPSSCSTSIPYEWYTNNDIANFHASVFAPRQFGGAAAAWLGSSDLLSAVDDMATEALLFQTGYLTITGETDLAALGSIPTGLPQPRSAAEPEGFESLESLRATWSTDARTATRPARETSSRRHASAQLAADQASRELPRIVEIGP